MTYVSLYLRRGKIFLSPHAKTEAGFLIGIEPVLAFDEQEKAATAAAILKQLQHPLPVVPTPPLTFNFAGPLLHAAGVKSWSAFAKSASLVSATMKGGVVELMPHEQLPRNGGFVPRLEYGKQVPHEVGAIAGALSQLWDLAR